MTERVETLLTEALTYSRYTTEADSAWARALIASSHPALEVPFQPCVVMEDYQPGNVTITGASGRWRVGGVFDLMTQRFGDGEADLSRLGRMYAWEEPALAWSFIHSYRARCPSRPGFAQRFAVYMLLDSLIIWTFCLRRDDIWWPEDYTLRAWVEDTLGVILGQGLLNG
ncbi:MAG: phosphotransferase [Ktedonobacterales bacterium]